MKKDHNGLIGFLIILAFIIIIIGLFFVIYFRRYILFLLGIAFLIVTIILNYKYEKEKEASNKSKIKPIDIDETKNYHKSQTKYNNIFTALYDANNKLVAQDIQLPTNDLFLLSGYPEGIYFFKTVGMDKFGRWITLSTQVVIYQYAKPLTIITEEQYKGIK